MISNFHAIIFEYHQFLFQFWKETCLSLRTISDNLVRDGFRLLFYYHYGGDIFFRREGVCRTYLFQDVGIFCVKSRLAEEFF